jgi:hypothetical protein
MLERPVVSNPANQFLMLDCRLVHAEVEAGLKECVHPWQR